MSKNRATALTSKNSFVASLERFERSTRCLEGSRSIQLSYRDSLTLLKI